jgi:hypothetical protein
MAGTITQAVNNDFGNKKLFKEIGNDLLLIAAGLGTEGSMIRINNRDPAAGRLLRMNMKKTIFSDVIKNEIKDAESNFPLKRNNFFNRTRSRMPAYTKNYYVDKTNAQNAFRSGFTINPYKGQFFREGGTANRQAAPSETLTSRLSGKQEEGVSETRAPPNEGVINGPGEERPPQNILSEGGQIREIFMALETNRWPLLCRVWYYCKLYRQTKSVRLLGEPQKMERVSCHAQDTSGIGQNSRGLVEDWNDREVPLQETYLGKPYTSSAKTRGEVQAGDGLYKSKQVYETYPFQIGSSYPKRFIWRRTILRSRSI